MAISTKDCKEFIDYISQIIDTSSTDKWKRTRKYKEGDLVLRDFENQEGRILTICEKDGKLSLYQLNSAFVEETIEDDWGKKYLGRKATQEDIANFLSECIKADNEIVYEDDIEAAQKAKSWRELWLIDCSEDEDADKLDFDLYYVGDNGESVSVQDKTTFIHTFFMPDFDTAYRISVFETKDKYLYLGKNNPD